MIVYVNGDSYPTVSDGRCYSDFLARHYNCQSINNSISGSSNSRIFRTSLRDLIQLKNQHADIVAIISLTFIIRTELWDSDASNTRFVNDGEFTTIPTTTSKRWFYDNEKANESKYQKYADQWLRWYNVEAEAVKLLKEILLLTTWCKQYNIKYVVVSGPLQEPVDFLAPFIKPFADEIAQDKNVLDPFTTSFTEWCLGRGHTPIDEFTQEIHGKTYIVGHHGEAAHQDFANYLLENYLNEI